MGITWTLLADLLTLGTAVYTYSMARLMRNTYIDERHPFVGFEGIQLETVVSPDKKISSVTVGLMLRNYGKSVLKYYIKTIHVTVNERTLDEPQFLNSGGYIYPTMVRNFYFPPIPGVDIKDGIRGIIEFTVEYYAKHDKKHKQFSQKLQYFSLAPGHIRYIFLNEDEGW